MNGLNSFLHLSLKKISRAFVLAAAFLLLSIGLRAQPEAGKNGVAVSMARSCMITRKKYKNLADLPSYTKVRQKMKRLLDQNRSDNL